MSARFNHYPDVLELYPGLKGQNIAGVTYGYVPLDELRKVQDELGYRTPNGAEVFEIEGPKGCVETMAVYKGKPIPGISPDQCRPALRISPSLAKRTGLAIDGFAAVEEKPDAARKGQKSQGSGSEHSSTA